MQFDNRTSIIKLNKRRYISFISYSVLLIFVFFSGWFDKPVLKIDKSVYVIVFSLIYLVYIAVSFIINYSFVSFGDNNDAYVFKFVSLRPFDSKKKSIVIKKELFAGAQYNKSFFGLKQDLILFAKTKNGIVAYPSISISALDTKQIMALKKALQVSFSR